jgi:hypothetical protein
MLLWSLPKYLESAVHMIHVAPVMDKKVDASIQSVEASHSKNELYDKLDFKLILEEDVLPWP